MVESLVVALAGGVAGRILAWWAINALGAFNLPIIVDLTLDYRVFAFALALSLASGLAFGLAPALGATRPDVLPGLKGEGDGVSLDHRWRGSSGDRGCLVTGKTSGEDGSARGAPAQLIPRGSTSSSRLPYTACPPLLPAETARRSPATPRR